MTAACKWKDCYSIRTLIFFVLGFPPFHVFPLFRHRLLRFEYHFKISQPLLALPCFVATLPCACYYPWTQTSVAEHLRTRQNSFSFFGLVSCCPPLGPFCQCSWALSTCCWLFPFLFPDFLGNLRSNFATYWLTGVGGNLAFEQSPGFQPFAHEVVTSLSFLPLFE